MNLFRKKNDNNESISSVSIVMPVYNGEKYIREAIDSVLAQTFTNWELVIVDDGSDDGTCEIVKSYTDGRIMYFPKEHSGISDTLNEGINYSAGEFIARMDCDDIMLPDRLERQVAIMKANRSIDILGGGFERFGDCESSTWGWDGEVSMDMLYNGNVIAHPTVMMRRSSIKKLPFIYEKLYGGAEDWKFWFTALSHGLRIYNSSSIVIKYRIHAKQETKARVEKVHFISEMVRRAYTSINTRTAKLTCIIPFQNEGIEIEKTVTSIRSTAKNVNIILIDDKSDDGYDYARVADIFGCTFIKNKKNLGVAGSRDLGVSMCKTPYFVLFDGHMRFYEQGWDERICSLLDSQPNSIVATNTSIILIENGTYVNEDGTDKKYAHDSIGTSISFDNGHEFNVEWTTHVMPGFTKSAVVPVSCVYGAVYASSVAWWNHIGGLYGLVKYGYDEQLMSIKTWLAGGNVLLIRDMYVGHLYRKKMPYCVKPETNFYNQLFLTYLFLNDADEINRIEQNIRVRASNRLFKKTLRMLEHNIKAIYAYKEYFWKNVAVKDFKEFLAINNEVYQKPINTKLFYANEIYKARYVNIGKDIFMSLVSKCGCSTLYKIMLQRDGLCDYIGIHDSMFAFWGKLGKYSVDESELPEGSKRVAVIRNPLERIESAYNTIGANMSLDSYIDHVICHLASYKDNVDRHIASQFSLYDYKSIDLFIPIEQLDDYLESIGIHIERVNVSRNTVKIRDERLMKLLEKDFAIYNEIINSDKCRKTEINNTI